MYTQNDNEIINDDNNQENIDKITDNEKTYELYLDFLKNEYLFERNKNHNFTIRGGVLLAFLATLITLLINKINLSLLVNEALNKWKCVLIIPIFIKILLVILIYIFAVMSFYNLKKILVAKTVLVPDVTTIDTKEISNGYIHASSVIISIYKHAIIHYQKINNESANHLTNSIIYILKLLICIFIYFLFY